MRCEIVCYAVLEDPYRAGYGTSRGCCKCNTHGMVDWAPYVIVGDLCPVGKVEQAVEDGLEKIRQAVSEVAR
jgi:hypothetical protein